MIRGQRERFSEAANRKIKRICLWEKQKVAQLPDLGEYYSPAQFLLLSSVFLTVLCTHQQFSLTARAVLFGLQAMPARRNLFLKAGSPSILLDN